MSSLDIYVSLKLEAIKILKLCVFLIVIFLLGLLHLDFNFFLNVLISLSLNDSAHNILNDVLKVIFIWSCWKFALHWF